MRKLLKFKSDQILTPDIDFPYVADPEGLFSPGYDCVYAWPEDSIQLNISRPYTDKAGFDMERMLKRTDYGLQGLELTKKPSHTYTLSLRNSLIASCVHAVWTSAGVPLVMRRADQKKLDYDYSAIDDSHNIAMPNAPFEYLEGSYYLLSDRWTGHNLYHWTYDAVARLKVYFELKKHAPKLRLLCIGEHSLSFHTEWLELLDISDQVVRVSEHVDYQIDQLIITPRVGLSAPVNIGRHLNELLCRAGLQLPDDLVNRKNIFINRRPGTVRSLLKSDTISACLRNQGFIEVFLEDFTIIEKLILAQSCKRLVGMSGSGMFVLSFMRERSSVLEITHNKADCPAHLVHSMCMNHNYGFCMGEYRGNEQIDLDPDTLDMCLSLMP